MSAAASPVPIALSHPVWLALESYIVGPQDVAFSFVKRLARENGWTAPYAARVLTEYKRFAFLAATASQQVTPSDAVDQAWHLHLTYTRDYWERFCPEVLGRPLHHGPTAGGDAELHRFFGQYAQTLASYEAAFGAPAPSDLWPPAAQRLRDDPRARRVHPRDGVVMPRWTVRLGTALFLLMSGLIWFLVEWRFSCSVPMPGMPLNS